ncbi:MAG: hypothetical protein LBT40_14020 [Deltaproteobacteria bacterium]|nr:hypothetical protein [Deltaproteobacteria bacterium]
MDACPAAGPGNALLGAGAPAPGTEPRARTCRRPGELFPGRRSRPGRQCPVAACWRPVFVYVVFGQVYV